MVVGGGYKIMAGRGWLWFVVNGRGWSHDLVMTIFKFEFALELILSSSWVCVWRKESEGNENFKDGGVPHNGEREQIYK